MYSPIFFFRTEGVVAYYYHFDTVATLTSRLLLLRLPVHVLVSRSHSPRQLAELRPQSLSFMHALPVSCILYSSIDKSTFLNIAVSRSITLASYRSPLF